MTVNGGEDVHATGEKLIHFFIFTTSEKIREKRKLKKRQLFNLLSLYNFVVA